MNCSGTLKSISKNWITHKWEVTFEIQEDITHTVWEIADKALSITIKKYRKRRSLDANAYYWQLLSKLAEANGISKNRAHNIMLSRYGQMEEYDGHLVYVVVPDTPDGAEKALEAETYHIKPTSQVQKGADGTLFRTYKMLRGSSTYDTKEMSYLIDGLVGECRELGIETLPPRELERMMAVYEQNHNKSMRRTD